MSDLVLKVKDIIIGAGNKSDGVTLQEAVVAIMRDSLRLEVDEQTKSRYIGGMGDGPLYEDYKQINVKLMADIDDQSYKIDEIDFES